MRRASPPSRKTQVLYGILALLFLISATYRVLEISERIAELRHGRELVRDPLTSIVNAGHNPPMVFRACGGDPPTILRLDTGGPVIGLLQECGYEQGKAVLEPGDLLVAFTDGISEAMNAADQEWGEERLIGALLPARSLAAPALISHIVAAADSFVGAAPQHDDMTLVVARCC